MLFLAAARGEEHESLPFQRRWPAEWRYSDASGGPPTEIEDALGKILAGSGSENREAAALLWRNRSFVHAKAVIELAEKNGGALGTEVTAGLKPEALQRELESADPSWGLWLAYLRPQAELVDALLVKARTPGHFQTGAVLALGKTGDRRALEPLLALLRGEDRIQNGFAAEALGDLGLADAEKDLIAALADRDQGWLQVNACVALGKIGTKAALPALRQVTGDRRPTGALDTKGCAFRAIRAIEARSPE